MSKPKCNRGFTQLEPLLTVEQLKARYLFGVEIKDNEGNELTDETLQSYINTAISMLEHDLDLAIMPRKIREEKDYYSNDYFHWGFMQLNQYPVIKIDSMRISYLRTNSGGDEAVMEIPQAWIRLTKDSGMVRLVPNNKFPSSLQVDSTGSFFPELFRRHGHVPDLWVVEYTHGFEEGKIPVLLNTAIGLIAAMYAMAIAGFLIVGAGIASSSISLDGLSQSISTTQSAENSGFSATRKEYESLVFGKTKDDNTAIIKVLRNYYKGQMINII